MTLVAEQSRQDRPASEFVSALHNTNIPVVVRRMQAPSVGNYGIIRLEPSILPASGPSITPNYCI